MTMSSMSKMSSTSMSMILAPFRPILQSNTDTSRFAIPAPEDLIEAPICETIDPDPFAAW